MKQRGFCAFLVSALLVFATALHAATVTTKYPLTNSGWTDLGAGPLLLSFRGTGVFAIGDTTPTLSGEGFGIRAGRSLPIKTTSHVWAAVSGSSNVDAYVAPISGGGGGGTTSVWSSADATAGGMTLTNGGLTVTPSGSGGFESIRTSAAQTSGKLYVELKTSAAVTNKIGTGLADASFAAATDYLGFSGTNSVGLFTDGSNAGGVAGLVVNYGFTASPAVNDVLAFAVDLTAGKVWLALNNVWFGSGNPVTAANPMVSISGAALGLGYFPAMSYLGAGCGVWTLQAKGSSQKYAPPSGFSAWDGP